ncbi:hypothetical protein KIN20_032551 [Parelaphostrongylus tenuis]|uniref:Uncharacterized protein n=1 Tax=Parelaphostrongylus tenuis TaxID=148309 RepID=A0AAD5WHT0_PARTN|nr:hypothetical protein KIN20_032551 [Parelaphostrongylus tenuis]
MLTGDGSPTHSDVNIAAEYGDDRVVFAVHKYKLISHSDAYRAMPIHNVRESKVCFRVRSRLDRH